MLKRPRLLSKTGTGFTSHVGEPFRLKPVKDGTVAEAWLPGVGWLWTECTEKIVEKDYDTQYRTPEKVQAFIEKEEASLTVSDQEKAWIDLALRIATQAHKGQKDKGGNDYILHPIAVAEKVKHPYCKIVALLHDVIEDTEETEECLAYTAEKPSPNRAGMIGG